VLVLVLAIGVEAKLFTIVDAGGGDTLHHVPNNSPTVPGTPSVKTLGEPSAAVKGSGARDRLPFPAVSCKKLKYRNLAR
jgi:hypothetical protein